MSQDLAQIVVGALARVDVWGMLSWATAGTLSVEGPWGSSAADAMERERRRQQQERHRGGREEGRA